MSKSKCNPRRRPATQADVVKAKKEALNEAIKIGWAIKNESGITLGE